MRFNQVMAVALLVMIPGCHRATPPGEARDIPMGTERDPNEISPERSIAAVTVSPFIIKLLKKAKQAPGREGFDPELPGYHLVGDIAAIQLIPVAHRGGQFQKRPVTELVFRIQTSPGMPPNVENLTIIAGGLSLSTSLSNGFDGKEMIEVRRHSDGPQSDPEMVPQSRYVTLKVVGDAVELRLLPAAMALLKDGGEIRWIDWYRG